MLGVLVGMTQEARIIRRFLPDCPIALSHASADGAAAGTKRLIAAGVTHLLSFGCAGGLSSSVVPGTIVIADAVIANGISYKTDPELSRSFGAHHSRQGCIFHSDSLIETPAEKHRLYRTTGCIGVDMESGTVAATGLPFAVLRVICDDVQRSLPPAAKDGLKNGNIYIPGLLGSLLRKPHQIPELIALGRDAAYARKTIIAFLEAHPPEL